MRNIVRALLTCFFIMIATGVPSAETAPSSAETDLNKDHRGGVVLVLSGGGTKGFAHIGVLKVLEREKIPVVGIVGTSMGSVIGGLYSVGYSADEIYNMVLGTNVMGLLADSGTRMRPDAGNHRPIGESITLYQKNLNKNFKSAGPRGILKAISLTNFLTKYTAHVQTTDFNYLPIPFACVAADLMTGDTVLIRNGSLSSAIRASAAIPGLLEPWPMDGKLLVDGGLVANLPVNIAREIFPGYPVIAVNLAGRSIEKPAEQFTNMVDVLIQTIDIMTIEQIKENEKNADIVLYPDLKLYSTLDATGYDKIYEKGLSVAQENIETIVAISRTAPAAPRNRSTEQPELTVRNIKVEGLHERAARDIENSLGDLTGRRYDVDSVNRAIERISRRDEAATVDVDLLQSEGGTSDDIDLVFSIEKRSPYEIGLDGYTTNFSTHRWISLMLNARDLAADGDSANIEGRYGNDEWGASLRYFTPMVRYGQWGFSLNTRRDNISPDGFDPYQLERFSARALYYRESSDRRVGFGMAMERADSDERDHNSVWGPYLYFNKDTLDDRLNPTDGYSLNSQIWWNTADVWVSRSELTAFVPLFSKNHVVLNFGLETGDIKNRAYRALLGDQEELYSRARHPLAGDQSAWARLGFGRNFYTSWWGSIRGEVFATYGMVMENWSNSGDAWETGLALSVPGQLLNGSILLIYGDEGEFSLGFTLGIPRWASSPLP